MRKAMLVAAAGLTALLAGCGDEPSIRIRKSVETDKSGTMRVVSQLECPEQQGPLTRVRTAADGLSCVYAGPRGAEVTLRLLRVAAGADAAGALLPIEKELQALMPQTVAKAARAEADAKAEAAQAEAEAATAEREAVQAEADAVKAAREAERDVKAATASAARAQADAKAAADAGENVDVRLPGLSVRSEGEKTVVRLPGLKVDADDGGAKVRIGGVKIDADDASGSVSIDSGDEQVNIRAHEDSAEIRSRNTQGGLRSTYILVDEQPSAAGWKLVGYEARGPGAGPLVVAVVKSKDRKEDAVFDAAKALVKRNVGGG